MKYIQRPNYFTSQFLLEKDFNDEQTYHRDMRLRHNSLLHEWGVVEGLKVTRAEPKKIAVSEGMAIDKYGREIVILPDCTVPDTINTINLDVDVLEPNTTIEITVIYDEIKDDGDEVAVGNDKKYTRTSERPKFVIYGSKTSKDNLQDGNVDVKTGFAPTDDNVILLAQVTLDNNGEVTENAVDNSVRKLAGAKLSNLDNLELDGTISAENLNLTGNSTIDGDLTVNGNLEVKGDVIARDTEHIVGDVSLGDADNHEVKVTGVIRSGHSSGALRVDDELHTTGALTVDGNVGIGKNNPTEKLEVAGTVKATRFEGDGSGLTGIGAGKWSDGGSNGIYYNNGNVGIGTNSTYAELTLNGSIGFANGTAPMMYIHQSGTSNAPRPIIAHSPRYRNWGVEYRDQEDIMVFQGSGQPVLSVGLRYKKVGIGITNPTEKLEVDGTVKATRFEGDGSGLTGISAGGTKWSDGSNNSIYYNHGNVGICTNRTYAELTVNGSIGFANGTAPMMYIHQSGKNNAPRPIIAHSPSHRNWGVEYRDHGDIMVFQGSGEPVLSVGLGSKKVGIGTNNPRQKLEVAGTVKATRFEGDGSGLTGIRAGAETKWYDGSNNSIYYNHGNVGIGTNSTYAELTVNGSIGFANGTAPMMYIHQSGTNNASRPIIAHSPRYRNWGVEYREHGDIMVFQGSGEPVLSVGLGYKKVGIGITNPTEKLEVAGTVKATRFVGDGSGLTGIRAGSETKWSDGSNNSIYYNHGNVGIGTNSTYAELTVNGSIGFANGTAPMMYIHQSARNNASRPIIAHSPSHRNWGVEYREHGDLIVFQGSGEPVLSVGLGSKKVGIGTNNPRQKLEVAGTVKATRFEGDGSGLTGIRAGGTKWSDGGSNRIYYNAGNVGIGTNNPTQKLEVAGSVKAIATNTGNRTAYGVQSVVGGNRNGTKFGLYAQATGGTSGSRFGVYGHAQGGQTQFGGHFTATNTGNTTAFGVHSRAGGNGNGTKFGLHAQATGGTSGARFGVRGIASGGQTQFGGHFTATNTGNTTAFGVYSEVDGSKNGTKYGLHAQATGGTSGSRFGVYGRAIAENNSSAIVYGVYGVASGGKTSYAGYFQGNANVTGNLTASRVGIGITNPTEKLEVNGTVKATKFEGDGSGLTGISGDGKWQTLSGNHIRYNGGVLVGNYLLPRTNDSQERGVSGASFAITETVKNIPRCYGVRGHFQGFITLREEDNDDKNQAVDTIEGGTDQPIDTIEGDKSPQPIPKPIFLKSGYGGYFTAINGGASTVYGVYSEVTGRQGSTSYGVYGSAIGAGINYAGYFNGRVHVTGNITANNILQRSSREFKENINTLAIEDAIETLERLNPVQFRYKEDHQKETHIGFIAEDVPDLVASHDRKTLSPMDIVAVLTKVVKEQNNTISLLMEKVQTLEQKSQSSAF